MTRYSDGGHAQLPPRTSVLYSAPLRTSEPQGEDLLVLERMLMMTVNTLASVKTTSLTRIIVKLINIQAAKDIHLLENKHLELANIIGL